jgi:hypothetical protein
MASQFKINTDQFLYFMTLNAPILSIFNKNFKFHMHIAAKETYNATSMKSFNEIMTSKLVS